MTSQLHWDSTTYDELRGRCLASSEEDQHYSDQGSEGGLCITGAMSTKPTPVIWLPLIDLFVMMEARKTAYRFKFGGV